MSLKKVLATAFQFQTFGHMIKNNGIFLLYKTPNKINNRFRVEMKIR